MHYLFNQHQRTNTNPLFAMTSASVNKYLNTSQLWKIVKIRIILERGYNLCTLSKSNPRSNSIDYTARASFTFPITAYLRGGKLDRDDRFSRLVEFNALNVKRGAGREGGGSTPLTGTHSHNISVRLCAS